MASYPKPVFISVNQLGIEARSKDGPMQIKMAVSMPKPISWMGFLPQESMTKKDAQ
jgi:hypothetical protein